MYADKAIGATSRPTNSLYKAKSKAMKQTVYKWKLKTAAYLLESVAPPYNSQTSYFTRICRDFEYEFVIFSVNNFFRTSEGRAEQAQKSLKLCWYERDVNTLTNGWPYERLAVI